MTVIDDVTDAYNDSETAVTVTNDDTYLGPNYEYHTKIKSPDQLGMSPIGGIVTNVEGILSYANVLITGKSVATDYGLDGPLGGPGGVIRTGPLGSKFFIKTGGKCINKQGQEVDRSSYINTVPDGNFPLLNLFDIKLKSFKGLVPGVVGNMVHMNPLNLFNAFTNTSECTYVTMPLVDENDVRSVDGRFMLDSEIESIDPCWFPCDKAGNRENTFTNKRCETNCKLSTEYSGQSWGDTDLNNFNVETWSYNKPEGFKNIKNNSDMPDDMLMQIYFFLLTCLMIYIIFKIYKK